MVLKGNLILFLNRRCTVGCPSCNAAAHQGNSSELPVHWLEKFFKRLEELVFPGYIIWTGGEPFLSIESLKKGISLAFQNNFHSEILTAGAWFAQNPEYLEILAKMGQFSLRISLDAEHQDTVSLPIIISLINQALALDIEVNFTLREIPGREELVRLCMAEIKKQLPVFYNQNYNRSRWLHYIPHMPISNKGKYISANDNPTPTSRKQKWQQSCKIAFKDLVIGEDGLVYPCCGLFGIPGHERLSIGNPIEESWADIEKKQYNKLFFQILKTKGPYGICRALNLKPETWNWPPFQTPCHLCLALFHLLGEYREKT
jgi:sulfatase maturation enzyme AslB (radical SAM superfamily)